MRKILLFNPLSPGDVVVSTVLARDIHRCMPGRFQLGYSGVTPEVYANNPYIVPMSEDDPEVFKYKTNYSLVHKSNQNRYHFMYGYIHDFNKQLAEWDIPERVKLTEFRPDLHFTVKELREPSITGKYWLINAGGKYDFTAKWFDPHKWQRVVDILKDEVQFVQVGGGSHFQPRLSNVIDLVGKTSFRELMCLTLHAEGVTCVVTCLMHLAAAVNTPCVVVAGGREPWWWEAYTRANRDANMKLIHGESWRPPEHDVMTEHVFLHTIGHPDLDCCRTGGCWKSKAVEPRGRSVCKYPCKGPSIPQPKCLMYIEPEMVADAIRLYLNNSSIRKYTELDTDVVARKSFEPIIVKETEMETRVMQPPVTICVLCYGPYVDLHKRCLDSIMNGTPLEHYKLRLGLNEVCQETKDYIYGQVQNALQDRLTVFDSPENIMKYPMMRRMFFDQDRPIDTRWVVWFDDDSYVTAPDWLQRLSHAMADYEQTHVMFGKRYFWHLRGNQEQWIKQAEWYTGLPIKIDRQHGNRLKVDFATGGWWAIPFEWLRKMNWPDPRIYHNGGDVMMGEALRQQGGDVKNYEYGVAISKAKRRGYREQAAGTE